MKTLAQIRADLDLSLQDAAAAIGITPSILHQYESGKKSPAMETIKKIESAYQVSYDYIIFHY